MIAGIAQGMTVTATTKAAGVDRLTFYVWRGDDPFFAAALFQAQSVYVKELNSQVRDLAPQAVAAIRRILTDETVPPAVQLKAATEVLGATGALSPRTPSGNPHPAECKLIIADAKVRRANVMNAIEEHRQHANFMSKRLPDPKRLPSATA